MKILIVDDEAGIRSGLRKILTHYKYEVCEAGTVESALQILGTDAVDCILLDLMIGDSDGLAVLDFVIDKKLDTSVVVMTGFGDIRNAVHCMKSGADNYITKPIDNEILLTIVKKELEFRSNHKETESLKIQLQEYQSKGGLLHQSRSPKVQAILNKLVKVKDSQVPILITGETGTGKEVTARYIHNHSNRSESPFVSLNCAVLNDNLLESELFGHVKGAFTGADKDKPGRFEIASGGSLFLDELGDMSLSMQVKLLRILQEGSYEKVGGTITYQSRCRIIAATNKDLKKQIEKGLFREDLYYRLNLVEVHLPPLRERRMDIPSLSEYFVSLANQSYGKNVTSINPVIMKKLVEYNWPGNIRQLKNSISNGVLLSDNKRINNLDLFNESIVQDEAYEIHIDLKTTMTEILSRYESEIIRKSLNQCNDNISKTASLLGISRKTLYQKMKQYNLSDTSAKHDVT